MEILLPEPGQKLHLIPVIVIRANWSGKFQTISNPSLEHGDMAPHQPVEDGVEQKRHEDTLDFSSF
jgi:hypothetical protein